MVQKFILVGILLITPLFADAAGFAKESLFLSKTPVTEGETIFIHTVVRNDTTAPFSGEVVFKDGEVRVGAVSVNLTPGGADAVSVSWQPSVGSHTVTAEITSQDGTVAETESATFVVQPKPTVANATSTGSTGVESSQKLQEKIAGISPGAASTIAPAFATIDTLRQKGVDALKAGEAWAKTRSSGEVAGAGTDTGIAGGIMTLVASLLAYVFSALKWVLSSAGLFYPVFAIAFLYVLWRVIKRFRRPSYA